MSEQKILIIDWKKDCESSVFCTEKNAEAS